MQLKSSERQREELKNQIISMKSAYDQSQTEAIGTSKSLADQIRNSQKDFLITKETIVKTRTAIYNLINEYTGQSESIKTFDKSLSVSTSVTNKSELQLKCEDLEKEVSKLQLQLSNEDNLFAEKNLLIQNLIIKQNQYEEELNYLKGNMKKGDNSISTLQSGASRNFAEENDNVCNDAFQGSKNQVLII